MLYCFCLWCPDGLSNPFEANARHVGTRACEAEVVGGFEHERIAHDDVVVGLLPRSRAAEASLSASSPCHPARIGRGRKRHIRECAHSIVGYTALIAF